MLGLDEEMKLLVDYCQEVFGTGSLVPDMSHLSSPIVLSLATLNLALSKLSPNKATPKHAAPVAVWKSCGEALCEWLCNYTKSIWQKHAVIPARWSDADMIWPSKGKPVFAPGDLRPIGLQDVGAKVVSRAMNLEVAPMVANALWHLPQFAYTGGRTLENALLRVFLHCHTVRKMFDQAPDTLHVVSEETSLVTVMAEFNLPLISPRLLIWSIDMICADRSDSVTSQSTSSR